MIYLPGAVTPAHPLSLRSRSSNGRLAPDEPQVGRDLPLPRDGDVVAEALDYRRSDLVIVPQRRLNAHYPHSSLL